jgi:mitochondrial intermediate peptidase
MDLTLFGEQTSKPMDTVSTVADLKRKHMSWKHAEGTHWHTRFTHLLSKKLIYVCHIVHVHLQATIAICMLDVLRELYGNKHAKRTHCLAAQVVQLGTNSCAMVDLRAHQPC